MIRVRTDDVMEYDLTARRRRLSAELSGNVTHKYRIATLDRAKPITFHHRG